MLSTSASSKESSSGCWATYGWTHWICGQSDKKQDKSEGWIGMEPLEEQHSLGGCSPTSSAHGPSDLVRASGEARECPSQGSSSWEGSWAHITTTVLAMSSLDGRVCWCSPAQVGGVESGPRDKQVLMVGKEGSPGRGFSFEIGSRYVAALRSGRIRCPGVGVKSSQLPCCVSYQQVWM